MNTSSYLLFSAGDLQLARENQTSDVVRGALPVLDSQPEDALALAQLQALRYLFYQDAAAGGLAVELAQARDPGAGDRDDLSALQRRFGWLSAMAMLRDHPDWSEAAQAYRALAGDALEQLDDAADADGALLRTLWLAVVAMAAGILLEQDRPFQSAAAVYRRVVDQHIHPEGFFKSLVDVEGARQTYQAQFAATGALALLSEMARQAGEDLWSYHNRAVSANTAATYTFYYYFFPERWRWEAGLSRELTMSIMRRQGAYFEIVNRRSPLRGAEELFAEQRPLFSATVGGLTTLTHGLKPPAKKRWRLW